MLKTIKKQINKSWRVNNSFPMCKLDLGILYHGYQMVTMQNGKMSFRSIQEGNDFNSIPFNFKQKNISKTETLAVGLLLCTTANSITIPLLNQETLGSWSHKGQGRT